jgi:hypothetical protein
MARASVSTLLSLDRYAQVLGLNPAYFNQGVSDVVFPLNNTCADLIFQHSWQNVDAVSREEIAREIQKAERDLAEYLGWPVAPMWIEQDVKMNPRYHRPEMWSVGNYNARGAHKSIKAKYGKIIAPGQRKADPICTACTEQHELCEEGCLLEYSDEEPDGYYETATVTAETDYTNECEIKVYFYGHGGEPEWEIRPARTKAIVDGEFIATFYSWQLIEPDLWETFPTTDTPTPTVDLDEDVYVDCVDVYREYNDSTDTSAVFYWEPQPSSLTANCDLCGGVGCTHCTLTTQDGCAHIRDAEAGFLVPLPGTYDDEEDAWESAAWDVCRDPDQVKLYYYCGNISELALAGRRCDGLSDDWARIIAFLATARLPRPICVCGSAGGLVAWLQEDLSRITRDQSYTVLWDELSNPFGTRRGELEAWRYLRDIVREKQAWAGAV